MSRRRLVAFIVCVGLDVLAPGCRNRGPTEEPGDPEAPRPTYPGPMLDPRSLGEDFQWRQRVTARWGEQGGQERGERSFEAVLSKSDDMLILLGLSPVGMPGFVLRLQSGEVTFENHGAEPLPFPPEYMVLDVERAYFPWFPADAPLPAQGEPRVTSAHGERITESWEQERLSRRTFERLDGQPPGTITVSYSGWSEGQRAPAVTELENGWFGYALQIETLEQLNLGPAEESLMTEEDADSGGSGA